MTDDEQAQLGRAVSTLTEDCMHTAGYASWNSPPELPKVGSKTLTDLRYGIHDAALVAKRGYHPDAAEKAAHDAAVEAAVAARPGGATVSAEKNCGQQGKQKIGDAQAGFQLAEQLANRAFTKAKQEPDVAAAFAQWSGCMKESGYTYREPLDAVDNPKFGRDVTKEEIDTAVADLKCRGRSNVALVWYEAEVRLQKADLEMNAQALQDGRAKLDSAMENVNAALAGKR
ncbi:hypothetical protein [Kitasatospora purpeofusca]|uniref:hypothetical protein n=1 Tax=Kitasatospora purpeofusca TaxID=67352 RepID=UPI002A59F675|nr:hypothetical protein [Kitasatospora purpeofusca]MDY0810779.1 hypothetical protein [Kitasatospora purpeofusca]